MTGVFLWIIGLAATGATFQPNYQGVQPVMDAIVEHEQMLQDEQERNYLAEQEEIIIEDYFLFLEKIGKIKYARGCMGEYTPPVWSEAQQKRVRCSDNAFDCAGLVKAYGIAKGIITEQEAIRFNSQSLMSLSTKKDGRLTKRGDRTSRQGYGERSTGNMSTHFAMVSRDYDGSNILRVYDNVNGTNNNVLGERALTVAYIPRDGSFRYLGMYRINVYTNGFVDKSRDEGLTVDRRYDTEPEEEAKPITPAPTETNPLGFSVTLTTFAYDSIANRIVSYRYDNNPDKADAKEMIATMIQENGGFDHTKISPTRDSGLCQLNMNVSTNRIRTDDPRRDSWEYQMEVCLDKRLAVSNKNLWAAYRLRSKHYNKILVHK